MKINKETIIYLANVSAKVFISFLAIRLLTNFLSKEEVGNYYLILSIIGFINLVILNPIGMYYNRTILEYKDQGKLFESATLVFLSFILVGIISVPFLFVVYEFLELGDYLEKGVFLIYIFLAIIVSTTMRNILSALNGLGKRNLFSLVNILSAISGLLFSLLFITIFEKNSINWLYGIVFSEIIFLMILFIIYSRVKLDLKKVSLRLKNLKPILNFMYPIAIITFTIWIQSMSYRIVIDKSFSSSELAIAALGFTIPGMIFSSVENFGSMYFKNRILNNLLDSSKQVREKTWNEISSLMLFFYILTLVFVICFSNQILMVVAGLNYIDSVKFIVLGAIIEFIRVLINQLNQISHFEKETKKNIIPFIIGGLFTLVFFLFFEFQKIEHIYYILIASQIIIFCSSFLYMSKLIKINISISTRDLVIYSSPFLIGILPFLNTDLFVINFLIILSVGLYFLYLFNRYFNLK